MLPRKTTTAMDMATAVWGAWVEWAAWECSPSAHHKLQAPRRHCAALFVWWLTGLRGQPIGAEVRGKDFLAAWVDPGLNGRRTHGRGPELTHRFLILVVLFDLFCGCDLPRRRLRAA